MLNEFLKQIKNFHIGNLTSWVIFKQSCIGIFKRMNSNWIKFEVAAEV